MIKDVKDDDLNQIINLHYLIKNSNDLANDAKSTANEAKVNGEHLKALISHLEKTVEKLFLNKALSGNEGYQGIF